jgi:hypothetical protein
MTPRPAPQADRVHEPERAEPARHAVAQVRVPGSDAALDKAAVAVRAHLCADHALAAQGPAVLLAQELVWQLLTRRRRRPILLTVSCGGDSLTVSAEVSGVRTAPFGPGGPGSARWGVVPRITEQWGAQPSGSGVRLWGSLRLPAPAGDPTEEERR